MLVLGSLTHVGMVREVNQDSFCALLAPNAPLGADALLAVADGMGGHAAGDVASRLAIQQLVASLSAPSGNSAGDASGNEDRLREAVALGNSKVFQASEKPEYHGMGTTMTAALITGDTANLVQVGDSRAYLLRDGEFKQITRDHNWVAEQVAAGALTPEEAKTHPRRNVLTRAVGTGPGVDMDSGAVTLKDGDVLLLCSDGLHGLVRDEEMARVINEQEPQQACQTLVEMANAAGGTDNSTVIVARVGSTVMTPGERQAAAERLSKTTAHFGPKRRGSGTKALLVLTSPVWGPLWLIWKAVRYQPEEKKRKRR